MHTSKLFLLAAVATAMSALTAPAFAQSAGPSLVVDAATGAVLHEDKANIAWHPASTTKMMTAYVALRAVRAGRIGLETAIPASPLAARQPRVKVYIKAGQEITLDNALKVMMVKSANDIAYVIAEGVGGSVPAFVDMMNAEARRLGMADTAFRNPNGWHDPEQQSSARDLAILAMTMLREFPDHADYWGIGAVQLGRVTLANTNGLIGRYAGANGFKTGFVCASGFNVVATATRGGRTLIAVVLGAYSGAERTVKAAQILDAAFSSWGGGGRSVANMPPSGTTAQSICAEVRAFGRGAPLADDADTTGPISFFPGASAGEGVSLYASAGPAAATAMRAQAGRITLGPREAFTPIQVSYGRSAGSAQAPLAANVMRRPASAVAGAGASPGMTPRSDTARSPAAPGALAGAAAAAFAATRASQGAADGPIRLPGAIGMGAPAAPAPLRPSAAAGIRPPAAPRSAALAGAGQEPAQAVRPASMSPPRPAPGARPATAKPATARPSAARPATARPSAARPSAARPARAAGGAAPPRRPAQAQN